MQEVNAYFRAGHRGRHTRIILLLLTSSSFGLIASPATAQDGPNTIPPPPARSVIDSNGVDVSRGTISQSMQALSIGAEDNTGLSFSTLNYNSGWTNTARAAVSVSGTITTVTIDGISDRFTCTGQACVSLDGNGASLTWTSTAYDYVSRNGVTASFLRGGGYDVPAARATSIGFPNGLKINYHYKTTQFCDDSSCNPSYLVYRMQSITNSMGYQIKFSYASNATIVHGAVYADWSRLVSATALNNGIDYCNPVAGTCAYSISWPSIQLNSSSDASGNKIFSVVNAIGNETRYTSDPTNRLIRIKRAGASTDSGIVAYNAQGRVSSLTLDGVTYAYAYAVAGTTMTTTVTYPNARTRVYVSDTSTNLLTSAKDELGRTTRYLYDSKGNIERITQPEGDYTAYQYDARGNLVEARAVPKAGSTLPNLVTSASYPADCTNVRVCNQPQWLIDAKGNQTDYAYDPVHGGILGVTLPAAETGAIRASTSVGYTSLQARYKNSSGVVAASGLPIYLPSSVSTCQTTSTCSGTADEVKTTFTYGAGASLNNLLVTRIARSAGNGSSPSAESFTYDNIGNRISVDGPLAGTADTVWSRYDQIRRVYGVVRPDPDGPGPGAYRASRFTFNPDNQVTDAEDGIVYGLTDPDWQAFSSMRKVSSTFDANARRTKETLTGAGETFAVTQFTYDNLGRPDCTAVRMNPAIWGSQTPSCVPDTAGALGPDRITRHTYSAAGELAKVQSGFGLTPGQIDDETSTFTSNSKLLTKTDALGSRTTYEYDGHDRLSKVRYPSPTARGTSSTTDFEQPEYDNNNNVISLRLRDSQIISYAYDNRDRLVTKTRPVPEPVISYSYDLLSRLKTVSQSGNSLAFTYDALGRNLTQTGPHGTYSFSFDAAGRRTRMAWPDSFFVTYDWNLANEVTAIRESGALSGVGVLVQYAYSNLGDRTSIVRGNGTSATITPNNAGEVMGLFQNFTDIPAAVSFSYSYNGAGQIATRQASSHRYSPNLAALNQAYSTNGLDQYTSVGGVALAYDGRGNTVIIGTNNYSYSSENNLVSAPGIALSYDPLGRLYQTVGAATVRRSYDGVTIVAEYNSANALQRRYVQGPGTNEPVVWYEGTGTADRRWYHADERGSVIALSNASGVSIATNQYDEWGKPGPGNSGTFQYTGQTMLPGTELYHFRGRVYNPSLGRFLQADPLGDVDGMNLYAYVGNDPINRSDRLGFDSCLTGTGSAIFSRDDNTQTVTGAPVRCTDLTIVIWETIRRTVTDTRGAVACRILGNCGPVVPDPDDENKQCPAVPAGGEGTEGLRKNMKKARELAAKLRSGASWSVFDGGSRWASTGLAFGERVRTGGMWDTKNLKDSAGKKIYPDGQFYGDFQYGALAYSMGYDWATTMAAADAYSVKSTGGLEHMSPTIRAGYLYAKRGCK